MPHLGLNVRGEVKKHENGGVAEKFCWRRRAVDRDSCPWGSGKARFGSAELFDRCACCTFISEIRKRCVAHCRFAIVL